MKIILFQNNPILLFITVICTVITTFIQNQIFMQILKISKTNFKKIFIIQVILSSIIRIILPIQICKIIEIIAQIVIYKKYAKITIEKILFAEEINVVVFSVTDLLTIKTFMDLYNINSLNMAINNIGFLICITITTIVIKAIVLIVAKKLNHSINIAEYLTKPSKKQIILVSTISIILIVINEIIVLKFISIIPNTIYILDIILLISYYSISINNILKTLQIEEDKNEIDNLECNNDRLQHNYDNICSFRHDFGNIMQGIGGYIEAKDIEGLKRMYKDVICECQEIDNSKIFNKDIINNPAIYNLINHKYLLAKQYDIKIKLEVYIDLNSLKIKTYELCRILGVLLDNAIEAAKECEEKVINIKFLKDNYNNRNLIVIENTCKNYLLDLNKIKEKGFSTKKDKLFHGLGLWKVNQIIKKNENLRLYTSRDKMFKQQLEIYTWE